MGRHGKGKAKTDDTTQNTSPLEVIQNSILQHMHRNNEPSYRFICDTNLKGAWEGLDLESIIPSKGWTPQHYGELKKDYLKIISILIIINWQGFTTRSFRIQFFREERRKDENLHFTIDELSFLDSAKSLFFEWQFAFKPAVIEYHEGKHIQTIEPSVRLPFVEQGERMGIGSYGEVLKASIARGFYKDFSQKTVSSEIKVVAVKVYHSDNSEKDFQEEVRRLDYLKEGYHDSSRVMKHIAAIVHGNTFMIVLPLAELRDLEIFLRGGRQTDGDTSSEREVYNFDDKFKALRDDAMLHREMIRECFEISSALLWLHEELRIYGKLDRYLAHMDLKPDNILIDSDKERPAGKWMISDFGVSLFDKATNEPVSDVLSARDIGRRATSRANQTVIHRNHVGFSPPEIGLSNYDGRKCDVWSFVCIMCDVLAFSLGRSNGLHEFRSTRFDEDDNFFRFRPSHVDRRRTINSSNTEVKPNIEKWLDLVEREKSYPWVSDFVKVIRRGLVPDPTIRPGIRSIMTGLGTINTSLLNETIASLPGPSTPSTRQPSQQLELPVLRHTWVDHEPNDLQEARNFPIAPEGRIRQDLGDSQLQHNDVIQQRTPALNQNPQINSSVGNGDFFGDPISQPSSSSNTMDKVDLGDQLTQHHHTGSLDTQESQTTANQMIVRSGQTSRKYLNLDPWNFPLMPKATLSAVALSKLGGHVAMLFEKQDKNESRQRCVVYIYSLRDESEDSNKVAGSHKVNLSPGVHWTQIWTANKYLAVGGQTAGGQFIETHNWQESGYVHYLHTSHPRYKEKPCSQVALSDGGFAAAIYGPHVILLDMKPKTSVYVEFRIDEGYSIKKADFGALSNILCLWAVKGTESTSVAARDMVYFYNVSASTPELVSKGIYLKAEVASLDIKLLPFPNIDACVIQEQKGATFIAHPSHAPGVHGQPREYSGIPHALIGCVTLDGTLICIEKNKKWPGRPREIHEYPLRQRHSSGLRYIGPPSEVLARVDRDVDENAQIAVHLTEDNKQMLILCTAKGVVHRFLQSD